jgi:hypothetical protein
MYVYSTLAASVNYDNYSQGGGDVPVSGEPIVIQGGANIPDKYMRTPDGAVITPVTEEQLAALELNPVFRLHKDNGFIKVSDKKQDGEKAAADMESRDQSAPLVDADFNADQQPVIAKPDDETNKPNQAPKPQGSSRRA